MKPLKRIKWIFYKISYSIIVIFLPPGSQTFGADTPQFPLNEGDCKTAFFVSVSIDSLDIPKTAKQALTRYPLTGETQVIWRPHLSDIEIDISVFMYETSQKLGLDVVQPLVAHTINGKRGLLQASEGEGVFDILNPSNPAPQAIFRFLISDRHLSKASKYIKEGKYRNLDDYYNNHPNELDDIYPGIQIDHLSYIIGELNGVTLQSKITNIYFFIRSQRGQELIRKLHSINLDEVYKETKALLGEQYAKHLIARYLFLRNEFSHRHIPLKPLSNRSIDPMEKFLKNSGIQSAVMADRGILEPAIVTFSDGTTKGVAKPYERFVYSRWVKAEVFAYELSKRLGFDFVPPTVERIENGVRSSMQLFVEPKRLGGIDIRIQEMIPRSIVSENNLKKLLIFDALITNQDRHGENFLFLRERNELVAIDHHMAFRSAVQSRNVDLRNLENHITSFLRTEEGQRIIQKIKSLNFDVFREEAQAYLKDDTEDYLNKTFQNNKEVDYVEELIGRMKFLIKMSEEMNNSK